MAGAGAGGGDTFVIKDVQTLRAMADPLRHQLLALLDTARTVRELAEKVDRPADRLYYHLAILERHGLIAAVDERGAERRYVVPHESLIIDPELTMPPGVAADLVGSILQRAHREYAAASATRRPDEPKRSLLAMTHLHLTDDEWLELTKRLKDVTAEFENRKAKKGRRAYGVLRGVWPVDEDG